MLETFVYSIIQSKQQSCVGVGVHLLSKYRILKSSAFLNDVLFSQLIYYLPLLPLESVPLTFLSPVFQSQN